MAVVLLSLLAACTGSPSGGPPGASYSVQLSPVVAANQDPFADLDRLELVIDQGGEPTRIDLGAPASGDTVDTTGLPELTDAVLRLEGFRNGQRVTWGEADPVSAFDESVSAALLVVSDAEPAWLGALPEVRVGAELVAVGGGVYDLLGGLTANRNGSLGKEPTEVYRLELQPPEADLAFAAVGALPTWLDLAGDAHTARTEFRAFTIPEPHDDAGKVLVAGGSAASPYEDSRVITPSSFLYDPATGEWEALADRSSLNSARARYAAAMNQEGAVVVHGGFGYVEDAGYIAYLQTIEVYDPAARRFTTDGVRYEDYGAFDAAAAAIGAEGVMFCGGAVFGDENGNRVVDYRATDACFAVGLGGSVTELAALPQPLVGHAMVTLPDGQVLVAGGAAVPTDTDYDDVGLLAETAAYVYRPSSDSWVAAGSLVVGRSGHELALLPDGRVLVVGGTTRYDLDGFGGDALSCLEVFDPQTSAFSLVGSCDEDDDAGGMAGRAAYPAVASDPLWGAVIAGGVAAEDAGQDAVTLFAAAE